MPNARIGSHALASRGRSGLCKETAYASHSSLAPESHSLLSAPATPSPPHGWSAPSAAMGAAARGPVAVFSQQDAPAGGSGRETGRVPPPGTATHLFSPEGDAPPLLVLNLVGSKHPTSRSCPHCVRLRQDHPVRVVSVSSQGRVLLRLPPCRGRTWPGSAGSHRLSRPMPPVVDAGARLTDIHAKNLRRRLTCPVYQ